MRPLIKVFGTGSLTFVLRNNIMGVTHKSYYDILGVPKNANPKQIRTQFLKKARQLHPDHNPQPQALQQFKQLKEAYQILKDPQRRYVYDHGISNENINDSVYSGGVDWKEPGRRYYENRWYQYKKGNYSDQRDEYYEDKFNPFDENAHRNKLAYRFVGAALLACGYFGYDYLMNVKTKLDIEKEQAKKILEGPVQDKKTRKMRRYIEERSKVNQVE